MAATTIHVHLHETMAFAPIDELVGVANVKLTRNADAGGGIPTDVPLKGLAFTDLQTGETHIHVLTDEGRQNLVEKLTGGIVLPN